MKTFKRVYYTAMAALFVLLLVFSIVDANVGTYKSRFSDSFYTSVEKHIEKLSENPRNDYNGASLDSARDYIVSEIGGSLFINDVLDDTDGAYVSTPQASEVKPVGVVQSTVLSSDTQSHFESVDKQYVHKSIENIVFYFPGTDTKANPSVGGDVVLITAHYDSVKEGAMANASSVAVMIENIRHIIDNDLSYKNDLLFVFTDAYEQGALGDYAFYYQFKGFNNAVSRIKACFDFSSFGNGGALSMYKTNANGSKLVGSYTAVNKGTFISSALDTIFSGSQYIEETVYGDIPSLSFANIGGNSHNTAKDTFENVNMSVVKQSADMMFKIFDRFGSIELSKVESGSEAVFFSYLDIASIAYPAFVSFILGGIIIGLCAAVFYLNNKKKSFSILSVLAGMGAHIFTVLAAMVAMFAVYFFVALLLSGFGVIVFSTSVSLIFSNAGILITGFVLSGALMTAFYIVLKKAFNVKAVDVVRGSVLLNALIAIVMAFAVPKLGYIIAFLAIMQLAVMLATILHKEKFKLKHKMDIERLFLYVWPVILCLPIIIPVIVASAAVSKAVLLPVILVMFMIPAGAIMPFANYLKPLMDKLALKMPKRTVRYEEEVTERLEDKAKKGKFKEVTSIKIVKRKVDRVYKNRIGVAIVTAVCIVSFTLFSAFCSDFTANVSGDKTFENYVYDNAIVYVWEQDESSSVRTTLQIKDVNAYKYFSRFVTDYEWSADDSAFVKETYSSIITNMSAPIPTLSTNEDGKPMYTFKPHYGSSAVIIKMAGVKNITEFTFKKVQSGSTDPDEITLANHESLDEITFIIPYGWGEFTMAYEGSATSGIKFDYTEKAFNISDSTKIKDYETIRDGFINSDYPESYSNNINTGIVIKFVKTV